MSNLKEGLQNIDGENVAKTQMNKLKKKKLFYVCMSNIKEHL